MEKIPLAFSTSGAQMATSTIHRDAAKRVLRTALKLKRGDRVVVFYDETVGKVVDSIRCAADDIGLSLITRCITIDEQIKYLDNHQNSLSVADFELLTGSRAVLTCMSDSADCSHFRQLLVSHSVADDRKVGHMPGVNEFILSEALNIDYDRAERICDDLCLILAVGRSGILQTSVVTSAGEKLIGKLHLDLGGIERPSIVSSGVVPNGTWGNLPGGETFIAPNENSANGRFILSGSFENHVLSSGEFVLLDFVEGRMAAVDGSSEARTKFEQLLQKWKNTDPLNYSNFAELGIGVNEKIKILTGRALLDEKCSGTVHIALGANHGYGGTVKSNVHQDLVSWYPSLTIDGHQILNLGKRVYDVKKWRESIDEVEPDHSIVKGALIGRSAVVRCEHMPDGGLRVRHAVASGRLCSYTVGDRATSKDLSRISKLLPPAAFKIEVDDFITKATGELGWKTEKIQAALALLRIHGLITVS